MLVLPAPHDGLFGAQGELAVGSGADPQVVAVAPVVEVVGALAARAGVGAGFVVRVAGGRQQGLAVLLDVPGRVLVGDPLRWPGKERGVRLQGELVVADVRRLQGEGTLQVAFGHGQVLAGQGVHQVQVEVVQAGVLGQLHRRLGLGAVVDPAQPLQAAVVEALDAEADPVHPGGAVAVEAAVLGGAGIGFQGDFGLRCEAQPGTGRLQEAVDGIGREQARGAAAEEHRMHGAAPGQRQVVLQVAHQGIDVGLER